MKKILLLFVFVLLMLGLCACGADAPEAEGTLRITLPYSEAVYDLSACFPELTQVWGSNSFTYKLEDAYYTLTITERDDTEWAAERNRYEMRSEGGQEYYYFASSYEWDGVDEEGNGISGVDSIAEIVVFTQTRQIRLEGACYGGDPEVMTQLLLDMLAQREIEGLVLQSTVCSARLSKSPLECNLFLTTAETVEAVVSDPEKLVWREENGIRYAESRYERTPEDPNVRSILCRTTDGLLYIAAGIAYDERNNVPADALDFISLSLAETVAAALGTEVIGLE